MVNQQAHMEGALKGQLRIRFWVEAALALMSSGMALVTVLRRDWIEVAFGLDPDHSSGTMECGIVVVAIGVAIAFAMLARRERALRLTVIAESRNWHTR
ncbi:MAG: hypothetical protein NVSMB52_17950 [Chloroflexota bacterium]